ncbi:MAG: LemA family protein [Bacillota bacterium]|nr:LemA family protein [Bacillota bacterium]
MYLLGILLALCVVFIMLMYNRLIRLRNNVKEAFSTMDVYLKKRFDLIPNLVETVKGYSKHESETLEKLVQARNALQSASSAEEKVQGEAALSLGLKNLFALAEAYPDLKANENYLDLQARLASAEAEIASARKYYNGSVKLYNNAVQSFPGNLVAGLFGFGEMPLYELEDVSERQNVRVQF